MSTNTCNMPTAGVMGGCMGVYPSMSIAALRKAPMTGCYELSHVGLVARTDSPTEPRIYVQDPTGGDFSAIFAKCSNGGTHACAAPVLAKIEALYDTFEKGALISVRGYYLYSSTDAFEGFYVEDVIDECAMVPRAAPISLAMTDITRDARVPAKWFQRAMIDIPATDPLVMYDFSPPELVLAQPQCPDWLGFAMIPKSAGTTAPMGCNLTANPAGRTADPKEIVIGRQFFNQFLFNTDCNCPSGMKQLLKPTSTAAGKAIGYLVIERDAGMTNAYQVFEGAADQAFPMMIN